MEKKRDARKETIREKEKIKEGVKTGENGQSLPP